MLYDIVFNTIGTPDRVEFVFAAHSGVRCEDGLRKALRGINEDLGSGHYCEKDAKELIGSYLKQNSINPSKITAR